MRYLLLAAVCAATGTLYVGDVVAGGSPEARLAAPSPPTAGDRRPHARRCSSARRGLEFYRGRRDYWNDQTGRARPSERRERPRTCERARELVELARANARAARVRHDRAYRELERKWGCIHRHERGADRWETNTGNGYYGGLQMDTDFQYAYGREFVRRWGYAHRWPPVVQMLVAERAYDSGRGFGPWPNTRRMCGV